MVHCNGDRVAILFLKGCISFLCVPVGLERELFWEEQHSHFRRGFFYLFLPSITNESVFAEGGYSSVALTLFCLLPTCLHSQQNKQVL